MELRVPQRCLSLCVSKVYLAEYGGPAQSEGDARTREPDEHERKRANDEQKALIRAQGAPHRHVKSDRRTKNETQCGNRPHLAPGFSLRADTQRALDLRSGLPLEKIPVADEQPIERAKYRVGRYDGLMRQEYDSQSELLPVGDGVAAHRQIVRKPRLIARWPHQRDRQGEHP